MTKQIFLGKTITWQHAQEVGLDEFIKAVSRHFDLKEDGVSIIIESRDKVSFSTRDAGYTLPPSARRLPDPLSSKG